MPRANSAGLGTCPIADVSASTESSAYVPLSRARTVAVRHVELYSRIAWVGSLLNYREPLDDDDPRRRRLTRSAPAIQLQNEFDDDTLTDHLVGIAQLAETLDRSTMALALRIVPLEWWNLRRETTTDSSLLSADMPEERLIF